MKRILMFGWELPPFNSGGLGVACYGLARALVRSGAEIVFVLPRHAAVDADFMEVRFATRDVSEMPVRIREIDTLLTPYMSEASYARARAAAGRHHYQPTLYEEVLAYAAHARTIAREEHCDLIYTHDWLSFPAGIAAKDETGMPLIAHVHATEYDRGAGGANHAIMAIEQEGLDAADHIIAVSHYTKDLICAQYAIDAGKIDVVHNGIDHEDFVPTDTRTHLLAAARARGMRVILFVGRITAQKGCAYFLDAAARVLAHDPDVLFVIAGSGDLEAQMIHRAAALGISDKVLFLGFVRGQELQAAYGAADLFVMPSVSEPFGITVLEAMLHETPVIVSRQSGVAEVARHTLKVDFWDTEDLAAKMLSVIAHPTLGRQMQTHAAQEARDLSWARAAQKCLWVFQHRI